MPREAVHSVKAARRARVAGECRPASLTSILSRLVAGLTVSTGQRDLFFTALMGLLAESGAQIDEITSPDDNLQAVFDYLIGK